MGLAEGHAMEMQVSTHEDDETHNHVNQLLPAGQV
jgi:hypothetical protein